ncbi:MAG: deoxyribose-phosphate aldolase [Clostridiales bacterium]|nr:deoxyribose-phosphate aldolase [Clostridiales bacterium]
MIASKYFDHTILKANATRAEVEQICKEAIQYNFASVCVNGYWAGYVSKILAGTEVHTCVVVGFPLGAMSTKAKAFEAKEAVEAGADEIDMVINVGALKITDYEGVLEDIKEVRNACKGAVLKVIIETCYLTKEEIVKACQLSVKAGADFVKTSTGFGNSGATAEDVALMKKTVDGKAKIKASGGIRDKAAALKMIEAGADRLGTSATVTIVNGD